MGPKGRYAIITEMEYWEEIFDAIPDMIAVLDDQQKIVRCNKAMTDRLDLTPEQLVNSTCYPHLHNSNKPPSNCPYLRMMMDGQMHSEEIHIERVNKDFLITVSPIFNRDGHIRGCIHTARDITQRKLIEIALTESETRFRTMFETMAVGVVYQNQEGYITSANPAAEKILGLTWDQMQGRTSMDPDWGAVHEDGSEFRGEDHPAIQALRNGREVKDVIMGVFNPQDKQVHWIMITAIPQFHPGEDQPYQVFTTFQDITEMKNTQESLQKSELDLKANLEEIGALQDKLSYQAIRDPLTSLFNRRFMEEALLTELAQADRQGSTISIIMLDIDHFKQFNDTYGHQAGDRILQVLGGLLSSSIREGDIACRYGGEEFVLIMPGANLENTFQRTEQIRKKFRELTLQRSSKFEEPVTLSAGIAIYPIHARDRDGILNLADRALYQAKAQGRNRTIACDDSN